MKKIFLSSFILCVTASALAQVSIQPVIPPGGIIQKPSLWNLALINTSSGSLDCRLELSLRDRESGMEVLTATSGSFQLPVGAKQINASQVMPVQYNLLSSAFTSRTDDFIPIGSYIICYRLTAGKNIAAEECVAFDAEPLSPPMLINPADSSAVEAAPSQFSWIPPAPVNLFSRLQYDVVVTEILPGQKPEEAIQENLPFYTESDLPVNNLAYTGAATSFEKDKWYAWQVTARDEFNYAGKSETWVFKVTNDTAEPGHYSGMYLEINDGIRSSNVIEGTTLHVRYNSAEPIFEGTVAFTDEKGKIMKSVNQQIKQGENYFDFPLNNAFKPSKIYHINVSDGQKHSHTLTFSINAK